MKTYTLKGKKGIPDIDFTLADLIPLPQTRQYDFKALAAFIDYRDYHADTHFNKKDHEELYRIPENKGSDFFEVRDTGIIVIPGNALFPTLLKEYQIR